MVDFETILVQYLDTHTRYRLIFLIDEIDDLFGNCIVKCLHCGASQSVTTANYQNIENGYKCTFCKLTNTRPAQLRPFQEIETVHRIFAAFRSISQTYNRCQFVFTGFKTLYHLHRYYGAEFINFTKPLDLGRLEYNDLKSLVIEPMKRLGIKFSSEENILNKLHQTSQGGIPWIIQYCCNHIIERLSESPELLVTPQLIADMSILARPEINQSLSFSINTSGERGFLKLIHLYRVKMGTPLGEEFKLEELMEFQKLLQLSTTQHYSKMEMEYYLDLFRRCSFLQRELKIKGANTSAQHYYRLSIEPTMFDLFGEEEMEEI